MARVLMVLRFNRTSRFLVLATMGPFHDLTTIFDVFSVQVNSDLKDVF